MGLYYLQLDALSKHTGISVEELKEKRYKELESMIRDMNKEKIIEQNNKNAEDEEYKRLVLKYFTPVNYLASWFDKKEIVLACANTGVTIRDICSEQFVKQGKTNTFLKQQGEYLRTSTELVPQYDRSGREYMDRKSEKVDVYRVKNSYQGLSHGKVIEYLLYNRYPELQKFKFKIYEYHEYRSQDYEIYPDNHIYVPFAALMSGDVDWILRRNREYCKKYNNGRYSPEECEKAFQTENAIEMFNMIRHVGEQERKLGHFIPVTNKESKEGNKIK